MINSNEVNPEEFANCRMPEKDSPKVQDTELVGFDMVFEQAKDNKILELMTILKHGEPSRAVKQRYIIENDVLYYVSDPNDNPTLRLFVPGHLRPMVVKQYHDENGHMGCRRLTILLGRNISGLICSRNYMIMFLSVSHVRRGLNKGPNLCCKIQICHHILLQNLASICQGYP